jgi:hypothetical protein
VKVMLERRKSSIVDLLTCHLFSENNEIVIKYGGKERDWMLQQEFWMEFALNGQNEIQFVGFRVDRAIFLFDCQTKSFSLAAGFGCLSFKIDETVDLSRKKCILIDKCKVLILSFRSGYRSVIQLQVYKRRIITQQQKGDVCEFLLTQYRAFHTHGQHPYQLWCNFITPREIIFRVGSNNLIVFSLATQKVIFQKLIKEFDDNDNRDWFFIESKNRNPQLLLVVEDRSANQILFQLFDILAKTTIASKTIIISSSSSFYSDAIFSHLHHPTNHQHYIYCIQPWSKKLSIYLIDTESKGLIFMEDEFALIHDDRLSFRIHLVPETLDFFLYDSEAIYKAAFDYKKKTLKILHKVQGRRQNTRILGFNQNLAYTGQILQKKLNEIELTILHLNHL